MKKILFAASECVPFIKTGGLADVVGSLPKYFDKNKYDVRVILPKYSCIDEKWADKMEYVDVEFGDQSGYRKVDMPIWEAVEVYQNHDFDGEPEYEYLVCYPDCMIQIDFGWDISDEDIIKVKEIVK